MDIYFTANPVDGEPTVLVLPFFIGSDTEVMPYNTWNSAGDTFYILGERKPSYTMGLKTMEPTACRNVWNEYTAFLDRYPEANLTTILSECYSTAKTSKSVTNGGSSSYPFRDIKCHSITIPWYACPSIDSDALQFGQNVRSYRDGSAGTSSPSSDAWIFLTCTNSVFSYINFAHGDEPLAHTYGSSLSELRQLKQKYDLQKRLN
ncbi:hypothetical protein E0Z10_g8336 [Xylaria hypoxylon]|uniref:Berberine/berberine-like domain-containing protein n=1 Tax=Xylaria hypoxylon TaxID=37992 RepID=A0A4Z0Y8D7_9PEZI|nr:hypothetical protein E0Z10_g8336 [Xylaria hypoxylon]